MAGSRQALIVATGLYEDTDLRRLRSPAQDVTALAGVLANPTIGDFDVLQVVDQPHGVVAAAVEDFFAGARLDDLLLLHLSCHGVKDDDGRLHFASADTRRHRLASSAMPAAFLDDRMQRCRARSIVLLLDCCYSGAFAARLKGDERVHLEESLAGHGRAVLTASNTVEYAWEGDDVTGRAESSLFTSAIVEGLESGRADRDGDGAVSVDDLHAHVCERVTESGRAQLPLLWSRGVPAPLVVARNPHVPAGGTAPTVAAAPVEVAVGPAVDAAAQDRAAGGLPVPVGPPAAARAGDGDSAAGGDTGPQDLGPDRLDAAARFAGRTAGQVVVGVGTSVRGGGPSRRRPAPLPVAVAVVITVLAGVLVALARDGHDDGPAAGSGAGGARFVRPVAVAVDAGGVVYVSEGGAAARVTAVGGGTGDASAAGADEGGSGIPAPAASLAAPHGIAVFAGRLYVADRDQGRVLLVSADGTIETVAGSRRAGPPGDLGPATRARLWEPAGVAFGVDGSLFVADIGGHRVRRVDPGGIITTVAGTGFPGFGGDGGPAIEAGLSAPGGVAVGPDGSLYIADTGNDRVRRVDPGGIISTVAGSGDPGFGGDGGPAVEAGLSAPGGVAVGPDGSLYVADTGNDRIRRVSADGIVATIAGDGRARSAGDGRPAVQASLNAPAGLCVTAGGELYVADTGNGLVRRIDAGGTITSL